MNESNLVNIYISTHFIVEAICIYGILRYFYNGRTYSKLEILIKAKFHHEFYEDLGIVDYNKFLNWIKFTEREFLLGELLG